MERGAKLDCIAHLEFGCGHVFPGVANHFRRCVKTGDTVAPMTKKASQVTGTAADVENPRPWPKTGQPDALQNRKRQAVKLFVPVAVVKPRKIVVGGQACYIV